MTQFTFHRDAYRTEVKTSIVEVRPAHDRRSDVLDVVLEDTVIYPEGGGQPGDTGLLLADGLSVPVVRTERVAAGVLHRLGRKGADLEEGGLALGDLAPGLACEAVLDWERRYDHMQQHTGQHLLSAIAEDRHGWPTTAFHLGAHVSDVELNVPSLSEKELAQLEGEINGEVRRSLTVGCRWVSRVDLPDLGVRSRGLPEGHDGDVRLVEIEGLDLNTCGGTHLAGTSEIESVKLLGAESMRGGTRLSWVAGSRTRSRLGEHEVRLQRLRSVLEGADDELAGLARGKKEQVQDLRKRLRGAGEQLSEFWLQSALESQEPIVTMSVDPLPAEVVAPLARQFAKVALGARVLLVASADGPFALAAGPEADVQDLGRRVAGRWEARGGGKGPVFQGKAEFGSSVKLAEMLEQARRVLAT